jgi:hypothetical protein
MSEFYGFLLILWFVTGIWLCLEYIFDRNAPYREKWSNIFLIGPVVLIAALVYKRRK